ncbi:type II toxin-antitoxin system VapC family toxin [Flavihumibacter fluvii]|uniref:type II toxin-antitoxin system VapC family toxin n=1 Tax=Flavihumibacter fluvii TaxID=2838157 RepID=UPI001BDF53D6|nr:PIN domain-containing protein [Flavihumibacter fluvii]
MDANILLDITLKRESYPISKKIIELVLQREVQAFITPSIVHILGYWLAKAYGNAKAKELLLSLRADIKVIDTNHEITVIALHSKIRDIEDALQYYTAIQLKLDYFISRDKSLLKDAIPSLPVYTPDEFLKLTLSA